MVQIKPVPILWFLTTFLFICQPASEVCFQLPSVFSILAWENQLLSVLPPGPDLPEYFSLASCPCPSSAGCVFNLVPPAPKHRLGISCCWCPAVRMPGLMLLWDRLFARAAHILWVILALTFLQKSDHLQGGCGLCVCRSKAELKGRVLVKGPFLLREALPCPRHRPGGCCPPENTDSMCRCFGDNGMDKGSVSCQRGFICRGRWFQGQKSKSRRVPWVVYGSVFPEEMLIQYFLLFSGILQFPGQASSWCWALV